MRNSTAFISMPFGVEDSEVRKNSDDLFELVIEPAFEKYGYDVIRADRITGASAVTGNIVELIQDADICVFDLTGANPNIMYECGRRHETGKPIIQVVRKNEPIPFDLSGIRTYMYDLFSPRSVRETVLSLQKFIEAIEESGHITETGHGVSLSSLNIKIEQIQSLLTTDRSKKTESGLQVIDNLFGTTEITKKVGLCFIIMPFTEPWSKRIYRIISECLSNDLNDIQAVRADDLFGQDVLLDIWKAICESEIVVAEVTGKNPNVFYELGMAHSVGTDVILISQSADDIPFDLKRYRHIIYDDNEDGTKELREKLVKTYRDRTGR